MKKLIMVLVLAALVAVGTTFADHPSGWGLGLGGQYGNGNAWRSDAGKAGSSLSLFLKAPQLPIYWGISLDPFKSNQLRLGVTGDYFLLDRTLVKDINFGWFFGVGGYFNFWNVSVSGSSSTDLSFGVRAPIGIYIIPVDFLELFFDIAPSVGFYTNDYDSGLSGGWQADIGIRFWF